MNHNTADGPQNGELSTAFSFDVFDTCVTRMHAYPRDLFFELGLRLAPSASNEVSRKRFARRFQRARIRAEKVANFRARSSTEHADIYAIYENLRWLMRLARPVTELVAAEVALEEESLYPITETLKRIHALRQAGHRIVFVSDMYIPSHLLRPVLMRKGVMRGEDKLYVSCDCGVSKHSGRLFSHVLERESLTGPDLLHMGDNSHADIRMAETHGIRTLHSTNAHLHRREADKAGKNIPRHPAASLLAAFDRRCRLEWQHLDGDTTPPPEFFVFSEIIPFLLAYVIWVLKEAQRRGISRLYFVARDGEILFKIAQKLKPQNIELRYLYGSRRAWITPSISPDSEDWTSMLVQPGHTSAPRTRHDILSRAGLSPAESEMIRMRLGLSLSEWTCPICFNAGLEFIRSIALKEPTLFYRCEARQDNLAQQYLRQEGLCDSTLWALVDTGWALNCQAALMRILRSDGIEHQPASGFYFALSRDRLDEKTAGKAYPFLSALDSIFPRRRTVVEHCFTPSTHPTTTGYRLKKSGIEPVFGPELRSENELRYAKNLHLAAEVAATVAANDPQLIQAFRQHTPQIVANAEHWLRQPDPQSIGRLASFGAIVDPRHEKSQIRPLCAPLTPTDVWATLLSSLPGKYKLKHTIPVWPEGSAAISPWITRLPMSALLSIARIRDYLRERRKQQA